VWVGRLAPAGPKFGLFVHGHACLDVLVEWLYQPRGLLRCLDRAMHWVGVVGVIVHLRG
jgi:hypothetical protein